MTPLDDWKTVCDLKRILPNTGVCALVGGEQVAIFHISVNGESEVFAVNNYDPFSEANVLSRGIVGDLNGQIVVASPIYKQHFNLVNGHCLEDGSVQIQSYPARIKNGCVELLEDKLAKGKEQEVA